MEVVPGSGPEFREGLGTQPGALGGVGSLAAVPFRAVHAYSVYAGDLYRGGHGPYVGFQETLPEIFLKEKSIFQDVKIWKITAENYIKKGKNYLKSVYDFFFKLLQQKFFFKSFFFFIMNQQYFDNIAVKKYFICIFF